VTDWNQQSPDLEQLRKVSSHAADEAMVVTAVGELDIQTAPILRQAIGIAVEDSGGSRLALDLSGVSFMGSTGLALLLETARRLAQREGWLRLVIDSRSAAFEALEITGLDKVFTFYGTLGEALADDAATT
jgi:anti-sigma B factor antagonist